MRVWSFVSQKGGSGKTTLVLHLSIAAMVQKLAVSVLDLDPQRSAEQWSELREERLDTLEPTIVHGNAGDLDGMIEAARETATDLVLIDTPPAVDKSMIYAAAAADVVIVPTRSNVLDRFALNDTLDYLARIGALSKAVVVLNAPSADKEARKETEAIAKKDFGVAMLATALDDQVDYAKSLSAGKGVIESGPRRKTANTVRGIYQEICSFERKLIRASGANAAASGVGRRTRVKA